MPTPGEAAIAAGLVAGIYRDNRAIPAGRACPLPEDVFNDKVPKNPNKVNKTRY